MNLQAGLIGCWPLDGSCVDTSGSESHGISRGADLSARGPAGRGAAALDGRGAFVEIPNAPALALGADEFTLSAWIHTERSLDDVVGDIASAFDARGRRGFTLGILDFPGSVYSTPNSRTLAFGIDRDRVEQDWTDCGRPGNAMHVFALCNHDGYLYAGTFESGRDEAGYVWRYAGGDEWIDCGSPDGSNTIMSLCVHDGELYCGTGRYKAGGSALPDSENDTPGGHVYRYVGGTEWQDCGRIAPDAAEAHSLTVFRGNLYAIPSYTKGVYRWDGGTSWTPCGAPGDCRCMTLGIHDGHLYSGGNEYAGVWRYEGGTEWTSCGTQVGADSGKPDYPVESQIYSFMTYEGQLHVGTWPSGSVFRYEGGAGEGTGQGEQAEWTFCGRLGEEREVMGLAMLNGSFYAGTLPLAQVYRYDGGTDEDARWKLTGRLDHTPDVTYRRAWSMAVFDGALWCGTLPSGHVWMYRPGVGVTHDHWLTPGWHHVVAMRAGDRLRLALDGGIVAESPTFDPTHYDLSSGVPLRIGAGPHDSFSGRIADVRLYGRALDDGEIAALADRP